MPKKFAEIGIDEILDYEEPVTAVMSRYDRIMQHRTNEAMNGLSNRLDLVVEKLVGVTETVHRVGQLINSKADEIKTSQEAASRAQGRQQTVLILLTLAIALATIAYTWVTWEFVGVTRQGNEIQRQLLQLQMQSSQGKNGH